MYRVWFFVITLFTIIYRTSQSILNKYKSRVTKSNLTSHEFALIGKRHVVPSTGFDRAANINDHGSFCSKEITDSTALVIAYSLRKIWHSGWNHLCCRVFTRWSGEMLEIQILQRGWVFRCKDLQKKKDSRLRVIATGNSSIQNTSKRYV